MRRRQSPSRPHLSCGLTAIRSALSSSFGARSEWTLQIPARGPRGVTLQFEVSQLYRPANGDLPRGALFRQIALAPVGRWWPPLPSVVDAALVGAALGGSFALVELPLVGAMLGLLLGGVVSALVGHHGVAAVTSWDVPGIGVAYFALGVSAVLAAWRRYGLPDVWRDIGQYLVVSWAMLWFNLLFWLNPETPAGDLTFHLHRLQYALSGHYFFTEGTPGGVSPYAIGLYVIAGLFQQATPFWSVRERTSRDRGARRGARRLSDRVCGATRMAGARDGADGAADDLRGVRGVSGARHRIHDQRLRAADGGRGSGLAGTRLAGYCWRVRAAVDDHRVPVAHGHVHHVGRNSDHMRRGAGADARA